MIWWYWILLGLALAAIELATPGGFFFIFFASAAVAVGLLEAADVVTADAIQWGLFSVISVVSLLFLRKPLRQRMGGADGGEGVDSLVGELAIAAEAIAPGQFGRAEMRGSSWTARNVDPQALSGGERCRVVAVRGLELDIRSERGR
jgi:membrane protein implicated in regulation of membrane protease activity